MRKEYVKPAMQGECFVANEYVSACFYADCNISGNVYIDSNGNNQYDEGIDQYSYRNRACQEQRDIQGVPADNTDWTNAFVVGKSTEWIRTDKWPHWESVEVTTTTAVYNWNDHVATVDTISRNTERPNHS